MSPQKREVWCLRPKFSLGSKKDMHLSSTQPLQLLLQLVPAGLAIMKYLSPTSIVFRYVSIEADFRKTCLHHDQSVVFFGCFWQWMLSQRSCGMPWQTVWVRDKVENAIFLYLARSRNHGRNDSFRFSFCAKIPGSTAFYGNTSKCDLGFSVFFRVVIYHFFCWIILVINSSMLVSFLKPGYDHVDHPQPKIKHPFFRKSRLWASRLWSCSLVLRKKLPDPESLRHVFFLHEERWKVKDSGCFLGRQLVHWYHVSWLRYAGGVWIDLPKMQTLVRQVPGPQDLREACHVT